MIKHILFILLMLVITAILIAGELYWSAIGVISYIIMSIISIYNNPTEDLGSSPAAGQAFIIAVVLGPIFTVLLLWIIVPCFKKDTHA